jgi:glycosyltransferase involved in cell wall biosynthesis
MKIFFLVSTLNFGGAERQILTDATLLKNAGYNIAIIYRDSGPLIKSFQDEKIRLIKISGNSFPLRSIQLYKLLRNENPDYIFAHMYWAQKLSSLPAFMNKTKLIFFEHGLGLWKKWYHIFITRLSSLFAKKIITVSNAKKNIKIQMEGFSEKKLRVIPNSFNFNCHNHNKIITGKKQFLIGFAGRFSAIKQLTLLLDIAFILNKKRTNFKFILLGDGDEKDKLEKSIQNNNLSHLFELPGYVNNLEDYLTSFDVFILPSRLEDLSVALLEASSVGLPCIAFDVGGNKEIIQHNYTGYIIKPFDINEFVKKLEILMDNREISYELGQNAKEFVNKNFNNKKRLKNLQDIINKQSS